MVRMRSRERKKWHDTKKMQLMIFAIFRESLSWEKIPFFYPSLCCLHFVSLWDYCPVIIATRSAQEETKLMSDSRRERTQGKQTVLKDAGKKTTMTVKRRPRKSKRETKKMVFSVFRSFFFLREIPYTIVFCPCLVLSSLSQGLHSHFTSGPAFSSFLSPSSSSLHLHSLSM